MPTTNHSLSSMQLSIFLEPITGFGHIQAEGMSLRKRDRQEQSMGNARQFIGVGRNKIELGIDASLDRCSKAGGC